MGFPFFRGVRFGFRKLNFLPAGAGFARLLARFILLLALAVGFVDAEPSQAIERRKPQFLTEPSYLFFPLPYSLPGIGSGIVLTGLAGNIAGTNVDFFGLIITGDAEGTILGLEDIHIVSETLVLDLGSQSITKALVNNYESRGMNSDPDAIRAELGYNCLGDTECLEPEA